MSFKKPKSGGKAKALGKSSKVVINLPKGGKTQSSVIRNKKKKKGKKPRFSRTQ